MQPYRPEDYPSGLSIFKSALFIVFFTGADSNGTAPTRYRPTDPLLTFLERL